MAYWLAVPGSVEPHGYSRCWLPPAAAYPHSASLGRNPPSQMQNAYASCQVTQSIGKFSWVLTAVVHVASVSSVVPSQASIRFISVGAILALSDATQPGSYAGPASSGSVK